MRGAPEAAVAEDEWTACMRRGDFVAAWRISDAALAARRGVACWSWPRHQQYIWTGESLENRRVLVRCYHGLGDTVQFIRFLPRLRAIAAETIVWAPEPLLPLLRTARGIDRLLPLHDGTPEVEFDAEVELMELAHVFRVTPQTLPADVPYLRSRPAAWVAARTVPGTLAVGLVWRGGNWDARRSIPPRALAPLAAVRGVTWHVLQQEPEREAPFEIGGEARVEPVDELAAAIRALDLLISVDSLPAHLGGALGVPTWTLLPAEADWRWMRERDDTPWYPTMRLFRQASRGDWSSVVRRVAGELARLAR
jgi:hypothetical protein